MAFSVDTALAAGAELGEGAIWDSDARVLHWIDITARKLHRFDPVARTNQTRQLPQMVGTVVPRKSGGVMVALQEGLAILDDGSDQPVIVARPPEAEHPPSSRFSDGKCDPAGRFWAGTMHVKANVTGAGALYRLDPDLSLGRMLEGVTVSNGIVWSADARTMYYIDSPTRQVVAFDYRLEDGTIGAPRTAIAVPEEIGVPDGMTIDAEGMLWVAHWGGWSVRRWNPTTGEVLAEVKVPASQVTSCAFGGANLDQLYITTAAIDLTDEQRRDEPAAGDLFVCTSPGVKGVPATPFAG